MGLNKYQKEVIKNRAGLNIVEACPGSGKTYTVEFLVAQLLSQDPQPKVGVFTFSKNASTELQERIGRKLYPELSSDELEIKIGSAELFKWICTIHALCFRILKKHGFKFRVLSGAEQWEADQLIKDSLKELNWEQGLKPVMLWINRASANLINPEAKGEAKKFYYSQLIQHKMESQAWKLAELYRRYHRYLKIRRLIDFTMMQAKVIELIHADPKFCDKLAGMFDYVIVDEAQDTSPVQMEIINVLIRDKQNLTLVGDVDQSMYAFRGAVPEVLRIDGYDRHVLPINYRSTEKIIQAGEKLIKFNYYKKPKLMKPFQARPHAPEGDVVSTHTFNTFDALESGIVDYVEESGLPGNFFILSRTRAECASIHTALVTAGIPAINKVGGLLFGAPHVRKVLAYARLACNYDNARDNLEILEEIANVATADFLSPINKRNHADDCHERRHWIDCGCSVILEKGVTYTTSRYYGKKSIQSAGDWAGIKRQASETNKGGFPTMQAIGADNLYRFVVHALEPLAHSATLTIDTIISDCVLPWLAEQEGISHEDLAENGKSEDFELLASMIEKDMKLDEFLKKVDEITQSANANDEKTAVLLGTFHWSKGAERPAVIVNLTRCPIVPPLTPPGALPTGRPSTIAEERRLAFVGVTRAKSDVAVMWAGTWLDKQVPMTPFINEII